MTRLKYLSQDTTNALREGVLANLARYTSGSFDDLRAGGEWDIELTLDVDLAPLSDLDPSGNPEAEIQNSRLVWRSLGRLTPSLAYEEGIWVRLTHVECLDFSRRRWLSGLDAGAAEKSIHTHFFADTLTRRRDDNALSRLWWNAYIARTVSTDDTLSALPYLLRTADIRSNIVERRLTASRRKVTAGLVRLMREQPDVGKTEAGFRDFMKLLNRRGSGLLFEAMSEAEVDQFMRNCAAQTTTAD